MKIKIFNSRKLNETQEINLALVTGNLKGECLIGRSPASGVVLDSADVSRLHGKFFQQGGNYYFADLASRNGSIINGKLAEINQTYLLKPGDVVRVGEFVLIVEEMDVLREDLAETVFGGTDATAISDWQGLRQGQSSTPAVTPPTQSVPREIPLVGSLAVEAANELAENLPFPEIASDNEISIPAAEVLEIPTPVFEAAGDGSEISAPIAAEHTVIQADASAIANSSEATFIQIDEFATSIPHSAAISASTDVAAVEMASEPSLIQADENLFNGSGEPTLIQAEASTAIQAPEIAAIPPHISSSEIASESTFIQLDESDREFVGEATFIQLDEPPADATFIQLPEIEPSIETVASMTQLPAEIETFETLYTLDEEEIIPISDRPTQIEAFGTMEVEEIPISDRPTQIEAFGTMAAEEIPISDRPTQIEAFGEIQSDIDETLQLSEDLELFTTEDPLVVATDTISPVIPLTDAAAELEIATLADEPENDLAQVEVAWDSESNSTNSLPALLTYEELDQLSSAAPPAADALEPDPWQDFELEPEIERASTPNLSVSEAIAEIGTVEEPAHPPTNTVPTIATQKYIALMAHDSKKSELAEFVSQHQEFFSQCLTIATPAMSETLQQIAALEVAAETPAVPVGGYQAIAGLVNSGDVLAVILLKDVLQPPQSGQANEDALLRLCNLNQVLFATNLATTEAIVHYIKSGNG
jgi:methylglyoxal synthase